MNAKNAQYSDHLLPVRVYYEDTDAGGVVYHANYLKFMERARCEFLAKMGFPIERLLEDYQLQFVVAALEIAYRSPARLGDNLMVHSSVSDCKRASVIFEQKIYVKEVIATEAVVHIVCVSQALKPMAIPDFIRQELIRGT